MINFENMRNISENEILEHKYNMQIRGYSIFPNFLDDETIERLKNLLVYAIENYKPVGAKRSMLDRYLIHDLLCQDIFFSRLLEDSRLQDIVAAIISNFWIMYAFTSSSLPPEGNNYGSRLHVDSPRFIPNHVSNIGVIWALDEFTIENGGTKVLPGSHNSPEVPSQEFFEKHCSQLTCEKGALIVFNARLWHRAGENTTNRWRHSLTMNICRPYMKQRMDWVRMIPQNISNQLNEQARRIIGFDTRLPTSLDEFFVEDDLRLYKPNQE
ncbi:phytanoyl-CoA dioxygenase family protein [Paenibacillus radicis (ex Xue et al. 2023)]|uniref:Phytanoyl-CoA dioxygenase family protein n=1 Tax=Paenibacillus radicis (ex Xue et al. 2023) TaxID=2972489 RepID=A0ABT1YS32_9BACL|nr:phytanoyl-CoA dioxygenase family protein [Paenibacillus radicis (ex Xue et al. 2023)]MCR8635988.1 phytanoyl-CoA dioxygenase family protein [Paenibacillus radicis (ex Xue et al. 2023)]